MNLNKKIKDAIKQDSIMKSSLEQSKKSMMMGGGLEKKGPIESPKEVRGYRMSEKKRSKKRVNYPTLKVGLERKRANAKSRD